MTLNKMLRNINLRGLHSAATFSQNAAIADQTAISIPLNDAMTVPIDSASARPVSVAPWPPTKMA